MTQRPGFEAVSIDTLASKAPVWVWDGYIPRLGLSVIVGAKGVGKTSLGCWLVAQASLGGEGFGGRQQRVFIDSLEDDPEVVLRPRVEAADAAMEFIETRKPGSPAWKFPRDLDALIGYLEDRQRQGVGLDLIILDSLSAFVPRFTTPEHADETLEALTRVCERYQCALVLIHHFNKGGRTIDSAVGGAGAVTRVARSVYIFGHEPTGSGIVYRLTNPSGTGDDSDAQTVVLAAHKLNIAAKPPALRFASMAVEIATVESVHKLALVGETAITAQNVFEQLRRTPEESERQTEIEAAVEWLLGYLLDGPRPTRPMLADAKADGFSGRAIERARAKLKVESIHPSKLAALIGDDAYGLLGEEDQKAWWITLPTMPDVLPEEWTT